MSMHIPIENTLVQQKMAKNSLMALYCQNQEYRCTGLDYGVHSNASALANSASIIELGSLKKGEEEEKEKKQLVQKWCFGRFQVRYLKHASNNYKLLCLIRACCKLPSYLFVCVTHLQRSLSYFAHRIQCTLIEVAIFWGSFSYIPTY